MIGGFDAQPNPIGMANNISYNASQSSPSAGNTILNQSLFYTKHSIFSAKLVDRHAYGNNTWVVNTCFSDHIVCSITFILIVTHCVVELPNHVTVHQHK